MVGTAGFDRMERLRTCHRGYLEQVYMDANYRGQGAGMRLLQALIDEAFRLDGLEQISLVVVAGNTAAINLYTKLGFKTYAIQPRYFKVGDEYMDQQFTQLFKSDFAEK